MQKFNKTKDELKSYEDKWCYFFKHADDPQDIHKLIESSDDVIKKAYTELQAHNWTNEELTAYETSEKISKDAKAREQYIQQVARERGMQQGMQLGRQEGKHAATIEIAKNLLADGVNISLIAKATCLSEVEIQKLRDLV